MKRIYISDVVHEQLKREARAEGRTLQWVVEARLTGTPPENTPLPKNHNVKILIITILIIVILILSFPIRNVTGMIRCNITNVEAVVCLYCRKFFRYLI